MAQIEVDQRVRLLKDIWDDGADHHPPGYLAMRGEILVVRRIDEGHELPFCISHASVLDNYFRVKADEIETA